MEGVRFKWRGCISTGGGAFQMEGVRFIWRGCISTGGGVFHMEEHSGFKGRGSTFTHAHSCAHVPNLRTMGNLNPGSQTAGRAPARGGSGAPSTAGAPDSKGRTFGFYKPVAATAAKRCGQVAIDKL